MKENFISVGGLIKKLLAINPKLSPRDLMEIVRRSTRQVPAKGDQSAKDVIDESQAVLLAQQTVHK